MGSLRSLVFITVAMTFFTLSLAEPVQQAEAEAEPISCEMPSLMNAFSFDLQKELSTNNNANFVFSPYSVYSALALLSLGAGENTKRQIVTAMKWTRGDHHVNAMKALQEGFNSLSGSGGVKLNVANNGWLQSDFEVLERFRNETSQYFGVGFEQEDFGKPEVARNNINKWVSDHTGNRIPELFPADSFDSMTRLVLANAIYFKGQWTSPFEKKYTHPRSFYLEDGRNTKTVDFMFQSGKFLWGGNLWGDVGDAVLELPYGENKQFSMLLVKPLDNNITRLSNAVSQSLIQQWILSLKANREIEIFVPRFTMKEGFSLVEKLQSLGITDVFSDRNADLSGITGEKNLYVSDAVHKAFIEVNEEGTSAGAATGITVSFMSMPPQITFDRPFLFFVLHKPCNSIVFAGRVMEP